MTISESGKEAPLISRMFPISSRAVQDARIDIGLDPEKARVDEYSIIETQQPFLHAIIEKDIKIFSVAGYEHMVRRGHEIGATTIHRVLRYQAVLVGGELPFISKDMIDAYRIDYRDSIKSGRNVTFASPLIRLADGTTTELSRIDEKTLSKINQDFREMGNPPLLVDANRIEGSMQGFLLAQREELLEVEPELGKCVNDFAPIGSTFTDNIIFAISGAINVYFPMRKAIALQDLAKRFS